MHGKWGRSDVPKTGWRCVGIEDLGGPSAVCEMCETQVIRYVHRMEHDRYLDPLHCGCVCAGYMEEDLGAARGRETVLRSRAGRKARWLSRTWFRSVRGNPTVKVGSYETEVFRFGAGWAFRVTNVRTGRYASERTVFDTADAAKLRAFDAMCRMRAVDRQG